MSRTWALMERFDAPDVRDPARNHMVRWRLIQTPLFGVVLHRLHTPDLDSRPMPHTHPWWFVSLVLRGRYTENIERRDETGRVVSSTWRKLRRAGSVHLVRKADAHVISSLRNPTWTLLVVGRYAPEPSWGYWEGDVFVPHDQSPYKGQFERALEARKAMQ